MLYYKVKKCSKNNREASKKCINNQNGSHNNNLSIKINKDSSRFWASQVALVVKNPPASAGDIRDVGLIPGSGRSPGGGHAIYSSILAWRISRTEEPGRLQSTGLQRVGHD